MTNNVFQWAQLKHVIPLRWKKVIFDYSDINENDLCQNHHVIKGARILPLDKLSSKEIYSILISNIVNKPTSNIYFEKLFENTTHDWNKIYLSPRSATIDTILRSFQYKILNNVLFLNKRLHTFGIANTVLCSFCNTFEETPTHIFFGCFSVKCLWERLRMKFQNDFILLLLTPQTPVLGLNSEANDNYNLLSHILLIFKYYVHISREKRTLNIDVLIASLIKVKKKDKQISIVTINKRKAYKIHREKLTGWVRRGFFVYFIVSVFCFFVLIICFFIYTFVYFSYCS